MTDRKTKLANNRSDWQPNNHYNSP